MNVNEQNWSDSFLTVCCFSLYSFVRDDSTEAIGWRPGNHAFSMHSFACIQRNSFGTCRGRIKILLRSLTSMGDTSQRCVYAEVPPYCVEAVQTGHFPDSVDAQKFLQERRASSKEFLPLEVKLLLVSCVLKYLTHTGKYRQQQSSYGKIYRHTKMCRSE